MNKSYKCDFCKYDSGHIMQPKPNCEGCKRGSNFELKKRMIDLESYEWDRHQLLDKLFEESDIDLMDAQREFAHRIIAMPSTNLILKPKSYYFEARFMAALFREIIMDKMKDVQIKKENGQIVLIHKKRRGK